MNRHFPIDSLLCVVFDLQIHDSLAHAEVINIIHLVGDFRCYTTNTFHQTQIPLDEFVFAIAVMLFHLIDNIFSTLTIPPDENNVWSVGVLWTVFRKGFRNSSSNTCN